ncbi:MAG: hypothetical protein IJY25_04540 [Bacilli bacterium]|nr:hypothetical protein [Bacilli bacterium]
MKNSETKDFVAYEYLSINVKSEKEPLYIDCYENFGWILINNSALVDNEDYYINNSNTNDNKLINLKFKRDRRIKNKVKLLSLQRKLETSLKELEKLEREPVIVGATYAMIIGVIGTIFMALSVFSITASNPLYIPGILFGIVGILGWVIPYFIFLKIKGNKEQENTALIEEQYNTIYDSCEQARKLID